MKRTQQKIRYQTIDKNHGQTKPNQTEPREIHNLKHGKLRNGSVQIYRKKETIKNQPLQFL